jgi:hypothetical protein
VSIREIRRQKTGEVHGLNHWEDDEEEEFDEDDDEDDQEESGDVTHSGNEGGGGEGAGEVYKCPLIFPCPLHAHRDSEQYCLQCQTLACSKCLTANHRKCGPSVVSYAQAVITQRPLLNSLHSKLAHKLMTSQQACKQDAQRLQEIEEQRKDLIGQIRLQKEALVRAIEAKEEALLREVNATLDREKGRVEGRARESRVATRSAEGQLSVLEAVISVKVQ